MPDDSKVKVQCVHCQRSEYEVPLMLLHFRGRQVWICAQCLPLLIHNPNRLATKFPQTKEVVTGPLA